MEYIISACTISVEVLSLINVSSAFLTYKSSKAKAYTPILIILYTFYKVLLTNLVLYNFTLLKSFIIMLCNFWFISQIFIGKNGNKIFSVLTCYMLSTICDYFSVILITTTLNMSLDQIYRDLGALIILLILAKFLLFILTFFLQRFWYQKNFIIDISILEWLQMLLFPILSLIILVLLVYTSIINGISSFIVVSITIGILISNIITLFIIARLSSDKRLKHDNIILTQQLKMNMDNVNSLMASYDSQRKLTHDFNNHLETINSLIMMRDFDSTSNYLKSIKQNSLSTSIIKSNNPVIDAILNYKYSIAASKNIIMNFYINDLSDIPVSPEDIVSLLGNLLDNAIEAADKCNKNKRVTLKINKGEHETVISIRNTISEPLNITNNYIKSTKTNAFEHGYGLKIIKTILNKYNASFVLSTEDGWFTFSTVIS